MKIGFKHKNHDNDLASYIISAWTRSKYIHSQIMFSNGQVGSSWKSHGVAFKSVPEAIQYPEHFTFIDLTNTPIDEWMVYDFIQSQLGNDFDMRAIISTILPIRGSLNKWQCSELVYSSLVWGGMTPVDIAPQAMTPAKLYVTINNYLSRLS